MVHGGRCRPNTLQYSEVISDMDVGVHIEIVVWSLCIGFCRICNYRLVFCSLFLLCVGDVHRRLRTRVGGGILLFARSSSYHSRNQQALTASQRECGAVPNIHTYHIHKPYHVCMFGAVRINTCELSVDMSSAPNIHTRYGLVLYYRRYVLVLIALVVRRSSRGVY